jgi:hypothetical protein
MKLVSLYGEDELNKPAELVAVTREYVQLSPASAVAHVMLAKALKASGQESQATSALLAARTAVPASDARLLATLIVEHVVTAQTTPPAELRALLAYAEPVIDRELKQEPDSRDLLMTKAAAAMFRADKLETNPARKRAAKSEADRMFERFRVANGSGLPTSAEITPGPAAPAEPAGFAAAREESDRLIRRRDFAGAARAYESVIRAAPAFVPAHYMRLAALIMTNQPSAVDQALKAARTAVPATAESRHTAAAFLFDIVNSNRDMARADARKLLIEGETLASEALKLQPDYMEALVYKSLILSRRAELEADPAVVKFLKAEADRLSQRARDVRAPK